LAISVVLFSIDPYSFLLRDFFSHSPTGALIFTFKCALYRYVSHIGWFGLSAVLIIIIIQLRIFTYEQMFWASD